MTRQRAAALALAATTVLGAALSACGDGGDGGDGSAVEGDPLPDLVLPALDEDAPGLALADLDGPAVVNLWATWCTPCRQELPAFQTVSERRPDVRFVGVDIGEGAAEAQAFLDELGVTFEQYVDADAELSEALDVVSLPVTVVVDADGTITTRHLGEMSVTDLEHALDDATAT